MGVYYEDDLVTLFHGEAGVVALELEPRSVQTIVTSPPYFGLRDYGVDGQLGAETSVQEYVDRLVGVFDALRDVLADDGTLWLNLGDSYSVRWGSVRKRGRAGLNGDDDTRTRSGSAPMPEKNLVGVPWRVAFALQDAGWILRSDIIWAKPNPMPESVTDRPTKAHEYLFLFSKSPRYYYDAAAIAEPVAASTVARLTQAGLDAQAPRFGGAKYGDDDSETTRTKSGNEYVSTGRANRRTVWTVPTVPFPGSHFAVYPPELIRPCILAGSRGPGKRCDCDEVIETPTGRGLGDRAPDPTLSTGRSGMNRPRAQNEGRRPITRREQRGHAEQLRASPHRAEMEREAGTAFAHYIRTDAAGARPIRPELLNEWTTRGWLVPVPPCEHPIEAGDTVLDPFSGSGTTGMVATQEGRKYIGIDLNREYLELSLRTRFAQPVLNLTGGVA